MRDSLDAATLRRLRGLLRLAEARAEADHVVADPWHYAVPIELLRNHTGMTNADVRWLANGGFAEHRTETTRPRARNRTFRRDGAIRSSGRACFVITQAGLALARQICSLLGSGSRGPAPKLHWDAASRRLTFRGRLVKCLSEAATTQAKLLDACEAVGWVNPIPNPWAEMPPGKRSKHLRRALDHLNSHQQEAYLHFSSRDKARTFAWSPVDGL